MTDFFAPLFEFFYYSVPFSDDLYNEGLYASLGLCDVLISLFFTVLFYYIINRPAFSKWHHWLIVMVINFGVTFTLGVVLPQSKLSALDIQYQGEYYVFGLINAYIASIFYFVISFMIRWWSTNAKRTPFPH
jgi:hypothetical protein